MKFAFKLTAVIIMLLSLSLSAGGAWTICQNHSRALQAAQNQNTVLHLKERYLIEDAIWQHDEKGITAVFSAASTYAAQQTTVFSAKDNYFSVLSKSGTTVFSNMPKVISFAAQYDAIQAGTSVYYSKQGQQIFMLLSSPLQYEEEVNLINAYDVSHIFAERDRQLWQFFTFETVMLAIAGTAAAVLSLLLTKPLRQLKSVSTQIAKGGFSTRAQINSKDEVGDLSQSFNSMAQAVEAYIIELKEENLRKSRFVAAFTHELKTPMTSIIGYADILRSGEQDILKRQKSANYIHHEAMRLEQLSKKLRCLFSIENGEIPLVKTSLSLVTADVRRSLRGRKIVTDVPKDAFVLADRVLLADLLCNLVRNSFFARPKDNAVYIVCTRLEKGYELAVHDKGIGINKQDIDKITEPFYTADKSRSRETGGSGLGLALCAQIAKAHNTSLKIESIKGEGTTVSLILNTEDAINE